MESLKHGISYKQGRLYDWIPIFIGKDGKGEPMNCISGIIVEAKLG
jgi:hypothetical protein